jgi:CubicO group peptidase (beta-lactamase class C family)
VSDIQQRVQQTIDELVARGVETGVQVSAYRRGEVIVDAVAGLADSTTGRRVTADTPFYSFSTGKGVTATVVHVLAERGELDYELRLAEVWPEFGQHGKDDVTLRHVLTHSTGVPHLPADVTAEAFTDWPGMCERIANTPPLWPAGTQIAYHAWTFGWLVGEVVRRVTGRPIHEVLAELVSGPLGVRDELFLAVPQPQLDRLARLEEGNWSIVFDSGVIPHLDDVAPPGVRPGAVLGNRRDVLACDVPATGTMTARAVARMYAALIGEVDDVRLISPERLRQVSAVSATGVDWVFGSPVSWGLGYSVEDDVFGMTGSGGSIAYAIPRLGLTVAATKNRLSAGPEDPMEDIRAMVVDAIKSPL